MKTPFVFAALAAGATLIAGPAAIAQSETSAAAPLLRTSTSFDLVVHAPYAEAAALFGPNGERAWAGKHWNPQFIHPLPTADTEGAVFTISHGGLNAVWVNTLFDKAARHFQYVYFLPGIMVTVIDVRFKPIDAASTAVNVVYTRTAIAEEGNEHVAKMTESDRTAGKEWQQAIDAYLASRKADPAP
jgi:hypothetical protein